MVSEEKSDAHSSASRGPNPNSNSFAGAVISILECDILLLDNNLALHAFVPETAGMATLKRIGAWRLGQELNRGRFSLPELPTILRRSEN